MKHTIVTIMEAIGRDIQAVVHAVAGVVGRKKKEDLTAIIVRDVMKIVLEIMYHQLKNVVQTQDNQAHFHIAAQITFVIYLNIMAIGAYIAQVAVQQ